MAEQEQDVPVFCEVCGCPDVRWLRLKTVAKVLRCSARTLRRMLNAGALAGVKVQRQWRVDHDSLHKLIEAHSVAYKPDRADEVNKRL